MQVTESIFLLPMPHNPAANTDGTLGARQSKLAASWKYLSIHTLSRLVLW